MCVRALACVACVRVQETSKVSIIEVKIPLPMPNQSISMQGKSTYFFYCYEYSATYKSDCPPKYN